MLKSDTYTAYFLDTLIGTLIFFLAVVGITYYLQSSLILFKQHGAYVHWLVILIAVPTIAGILMRLASIIYPMVSALLGAAASAAVLYPLYKELWAEPPTHVDVAIYAVAIFGIGYIATQPLRTTFMIAFRLGRFAVPAIKASGKKPTQKSAKGASAATRSKVAKTSKANMSKTQRLQYSDHGNIIAMMELLIGVVSLALSVFSVFFLGRS